MRRKLLERRGHCKARVWEKWEIGDMVEGTLLEKRVGKYGNDNYVIRVEFASFKNKTEEPKPGESFLVFANGSLNYKMEGIEPGTYVCVSYEGTEVLTRGKYAGKESHQVKILVAEEDLPRVDEASGDLDTV